MIVITSDYSEVEAELDRCIVQPSPKVIALLEAVLSTGFAATLAAVHIDTGSLKSSAKKESDVSFQTNTWTGTIRFGGPSLGVNNPVDYAIYEKARNGTHDFLAPLEVLDPLYVQSIKEGLGR